MANRRMLSKDVVYTNDFVNLSSPSQALYMHLILSADDDGFTNELSTCMFRAHASVADVESLISKRFIHQFQDGVIVITQWNMQNVVRKDRYNPTIYKEDLAMLQEHNGKYLLCADIPSDIPNGNQMADTCHTNDCHSIGKVSLGEFSTIVSNETNIHCPFTKDVIDYLNLKTGSNYKHTTKATLKYINARYKEGFSLDDFKRVIDTKTKQWINDPKFKKFLRPETLFSTHFEGYLNEQETHTFQGLPDLKSNAPAKMLTPEEIEEENNKHYDF